MEHAEALERIEIAAAEPEGLDRLMAGDTPDAAAVAGHLAGCPSCAVGAAADPPDGRLARDVISAEPDPALRERTLAFVRAVGRDRSAPVPRPRGAVCRRRDAAVDHRAAGPGRVGSRRVAGGAAGITRRLRAAASRCSRSPRPSSSPSASAMPPAVRSTQSDLEASAAEEVASSATPRRPPSESTPSPTRSGCRSCRRPPAPTRPARSRSRPSTGRARRGRQRARARGDERGVRLLGRGRRTAPPPREDVLGRSTCGPGPDRSRASTTCRPARPSGSRSTRRRRHPGEPVLTGEPLAARLGRSRSSAPAALRAPAASGGVTVAIGWAEPAPAGLGRRPSAPVRRSARGPAAARLELLGRDEHVRRRESRDSGDGRAGRARQCPRRPAAGPTIARSTPPRPAARARRPPARGGSSRRRRAR